MSTSSKIINFSVDLGGGAEITIAVAKIYRAEDTSAFLMAGAAVSASEFQVELDIESPNYYYIVLLVQEYRLKGITCALDERFVSLLAVFDSSVDNVTVGAQSTIAGAFCFAQMISVPGLIDITIAAENRRLRIAYGMKSNFYVTAGGISSVISSSPNGLQTNSYPLFNFLATLVYYVITDAAVYAGFLDLSSGLNSSQSFFESLMYMVHEPFNNVPPIYNLISNRVQVFTPSLPLLDLPARKSPVPNQFTLTIKAHDSGAQNFLPGGTAYVVFDKDDKAWISNNVRQGSAYSGTHAIVLNADASPCSFSPLTGGGILGQGFGVAINPAKDTIAMGNYGWGPVQFNPQHGSISVFSSDGEVLCPPNGFTNKLSRVQGMCYDADGNLWMASMGSQSPMAPSPGSIYEFAGELSAIVMYPGGDPDQAIHFTDFYPHPSEHHGTFGVVMDSQGNAFVSNAGNAGAKMPSSVYKIKYQDGRLIQTGYWISDHYSKKNDETGYENFRQVQVNSNDDVFVVGITSGRVIKFDNDLNYITEFTTNINAPWGITIDGPGTMYVANFGQEKERNPDYDTLDMQGPFSVAIIKGQDANNVNIMTLPTGGEPVLLANGRHLYGDQLIDGKQPLSYEPLMRLTSTGIDGAGNLWAMNNWKPSAYIDVNYNPGGDGVVIFVGVAEPA